MPHSRIRRFLRHGMLPQLAVFEAIARLGSFTRAAEELFMAQPTVSIHMKKLTEVVGLPLVEQVGKKIHLTDAGRELHAACRDVFHRFAEVEGRLAGLRDLEHGRLRIGASSAGKYFVPRLLGRFCEKHPSIEVAMHVGNWQELCARMQANVDDLYFVSRAPDELDVVAYAVLPNPMCIYAPPGHRLAGERAIAFSRLASEPFILREPGSGTRNIAQSLFEKHDIAPRVRMELGSNETIKQAVAGGLGIALLARCTVTLDVAPTDIVELDVQGFPFALQWHIAHAAGKQLPKVAAAFLEYVRAHAEHDLHSAVEPHSRPTRASRRAAART
jgi:DNA-binding transcriptional LysR family regulator